MATVTVTVEKIGLEDLNIGNGTWNRTSSVGGTQAMTKINASNIEVVDAGSKWTGTHIEDALDELYSGPLHRGQSILSRTKYTYVNTTSFKLGPAVYFHDGTTQQLVHWDSDLTITPGSLTASTWYYVYIDDSAVVSLGLDLLTATEILTTTTAPTWSNAKRGWYSGNDRCIFAFRAPSTDTVPNYYHDGGSYVRYTTKIVDYTGSPASAVTDALTIPVFSTRASVHIITLGSATSALSVGPSATNVAAIDTINTAQMRLDVDIFTAANQVIGITLSVYDVASVVLETTGYYMPVGM